MHYRRILDFKDLKGQSCFFWGPRQTGKSTLLREMFPEAHAYDLLKSDVYARLARAPSIFREECLASRRPGPIIVDEIQRVPELLNEVQWLMENGKKRFVLCGSSARQLRRGGVNLLGGRALRYELFPLVSAEVPNFDLVKALNHGLLPAHYSAEDPAGRWEGYLGDYLREEIRAEALVRNIPAFHRFLEAAAFSNGEFVNFQNIAAECGVSSPTVREYFQILEDTLLGRFIHSYGRRGRRRIILSPKFYYFDVGAANHLLRRGPVAPGSESFGKALEHLIFQELTAHARYSRLGYGVGTWRTASQFEVDFILGEGEVAVEVKGTDAASAHHAKGLAAFGEEYRPRRRILVTNDPHPRRMGVVDVLPWREFLADLWGGRLMR